MLCWEIRGGRKTALVELVLNSGPIFQRRKGRLGGSVTHERRTWPILFITMTSSSDHSVWFRVGVETRAIVKGIQHLPSSGTEGNWPGVVLEEKMRCAQADFLPVHSVGDTPSSGVECVGRSPSELGFSQPGAPGSGPPAAGMGVPVWPASHWAVHPRPAGEASPGPSVVTPSHACLLGVSPSQARSLWRGWLEQGSLPL